MTRGESRPGDALRLAIVVGALGVVFGDIGTSPIYTIQTIFSPDEPHPVPPGTGNVYGVVSLIFWSVMLIVTVTYVLLAMRINNDGEGGIMALITLLRRWAAGPRARATMLLAGLGILGAALFLGDSMITPAISVLSAIEGLKVVRPSLADWVVPVTAVIIACLFAVQRFGTAAVGRLFGPGMIAWFAAIGGLGIWGITKEPGILRALSPTYAAGFLVGHFHIAFFALAAIVLAVTGAEALYADMGRPRSSCGPASRAGASGCSWPSRTSLRMPASSSACRSTGSSSWARTSRSDQTPALRLPPRGSQLVRACGVG